MRQKIFFLKRFDSELLYVQGKKKIIGLSNYLSSPQDDSLKERSKSTIYFMSTNIVTPYIIVKARPVKGSTRQIGWDYQFMIWHVQNENFIPNSIRIFMKALHLLHLDASFIFLEYILIFGLILLLMIDSTSDQKDIPWLYFISSTSLVMSITAMLFRWRKEHMISFSGNFQTNNFNKIFQFLFYYIQLYVFLYPQSTLNVQKWL
ncbi:LOW QUALITY PROTEIN: hypothetical protein Cgig2_024592 [Carnegiea gigantea]|uniref:NAD(P)H-quinone oxidoreductase subunit 2 N-terminal domain-containing protein n=1 Tax=Carnegiea gigantea TaxID=171969 RepID=A0A9Q1KH64_9CARY|nr:LOW QUALITY PROTEIN: hypothetical protein Cgig2_024592 [Carnegiea gigantea]